MLPSLGFQEILLLGILALVVIGPKDLPLLMRKLGRWTAKLRGMAQEFRTGFDELARQAELDELKREVEALRRSTSPSELTRDIKRQLPTLEDYAGLNKPPKAGPAAPADQAVSTVEEAPAASPDSQASQESAAKPPEAPEPADAAPAARRAP